MRRAVAGEKAAEHVRLRAAAAVLDASEPVRPRRRPQVLAARRRDVRPAHDRVRIVARQQNDVPRANLDRRDAIRRYQHPAVRDGVVGDDLRRHVHERPAILGPHLRGERPRRRHARLEEQPALQVERADHLGQGILGHRPAFRSSTVSTDVRAHSPAPAWATIAQDGQQALAETSSPAATLRPPGRPGWSGSSGR